MAGPQGGASQTGRAIAGALATMQERIPEGRGRLSIFEMVQDLGGRGRGGGVARVAKEAGVSPRQVERWVKYERGEAGQQRNPREAHKDTQARITALSERLASQRAGREIRQQGMTVRFSGMLAVYSDKRKSWDERPRFGLEGYIEPEKVGTFLDAAARGDWGKAEDEFTAAYLESLGIGAAGSITEVDELEFTLGEQ